MIFVKIARDLKKFYLRVKIKQKKRQIAREKYPELGTLE